MGRSPKRIEVIDDLVHEFGLDAVFDFLVHYLILIAVFIIGSGETAGGGPRRDDDDKDHMIGENGASFTSKTTGKSGGAHIDVENPSPGKRPGDIHYQAPDGTKWRYDIKTKTLIHPKSHEMAPPAIQRILNAPWVIDAINKALKYLGE